MSEQIDKFVDNINKGDFTMKKDDLSKMEDTMNKMIRDSLSSQTQSPPQSPPAVDKGDFLSIKME